MKKGPKLIEYDHNGNPMHLVRGDKLQSLLQGKFLDAQESNTVSLVEFKTEYFPYEFWTKDSARAEKDGWGLEAGNQWVVLKTNDGKYLTDNSGGHMRHEDGEGKPLQKFNYHGWEGDKVGIVGYNDKWASCNGEKMEMYHDTMY